MNEKFTRGEWYAKQDNGNWFSDDNYSLDTNYGSLSWVMVGCDDQAIAIVPDYDGDDNQLDGNAHLIAAAPEMYEMLKGLSEMMTFLDEQTHPQIEMDAVKYDIDQLLARARGES